MKKIIILLVLLVLLSGCAIPGHPPATQVRATPQSPALWKVRMYRWGDVVFSGLLLTRMETEDAISYVLLDGTGIKLLQARVTLGGEQVVSSVLPPLRNKRLPGFMASALNDIFLLEPDGEACGRNGLVWLCREHKDEQVWKKAGAGPITFWSAQYAPAKENGGQEISFSMPWVGVRMVLLSDPANSQ